MDNVSVIIPVYNTDINVVRQCIYCCLNQININTEIIVVNDGSYPSYDYESMCNEFGVTYVGYSDNKGVGYAWDIGIKNSTSSLIAPLASDDLIYPNKLFIQIELMKNVKADFSFTGYIEVYYPNTPDGSAPTHYRIHSTPNIPNCDGKLAFDMLIENDFGNNFINGASVLFTRELYNRTDGYDVKLRFKQDYDLWLQLSKKCNKILSVPIPLMTRRMHNRQTRNMFENHPEYNEKIRRTKEYAIIKKKWKKSILPITNQGVDIELIKELGYV